MKCYNRWYNIMRRCYDSRNHDYKHYGRKGVKVCREWHSFHRFREWFSDTTKGMETTCGMDIDRIDPKRGYSPDNCRIVTHRENVMRCIRRDVRGRFCRKSRRCV